jgi:AcrR family transcriptional regulator
MHPERAPVKRSYDVTRRRADAERARRRVLDTARSLFLAQGYAATTMAAVAEGAGVSVETVYKAHGNKARLVLAVFHDAIAGRSGEPAEVRADRVSAGEPDPVLRLRTFGEFVAEVAPRVAPIVLLVKAAAATDPDVAGVWQQMQDERLARMTGHAGQLADDGHLRPGVSVEEARDVLWLYNAPEVYDLMVLQRGWDPQRFGGWVGQAYVDALLP